MNKTIKVEALNSHNYNGIGRETGIQYDIEEKDLHLMTVLGRVKVVPEPKVIERKVVQPVVAAEKPKPTPPEVKTPEVRTPEGQYQRRDLRAKD